MRLMRQRAQEKGAAVPLPGMVAWVPALEQEMPLALVPIRWQPVPLMTPLPVPLPPVLPHPAAAAAAQAVAQLGA